jgi:hypothetical protein
MGITIHAEKPIDPGAYDGTIAKIDATKGKFGERLQVTFTIQDGRSVPGFFPPKATANNKTGRLFEKALGKLETADSDQLIGKTVKVLIENIEHNGRTYSNVSKIL